MKRLDFRGQKVLITGGASGIGKIMARKVLERGASDVVLWDLNEVGLAQVKTEFSRFEGQVHTFVVDLSHVAEIQKIAVSILDQLGNIDVIFNNAGIVVGKLFHEHSSQEIEKSIQINSLALMHVASAFLPKMMERNHGAICNIASQAGLISNPKMSVYCASKWAAIGWSDSLRLEMLQLKKYISVTTIMPYYINTGMFDGVKSPVLPILDPEKSTTKILAAVERRTAMLALPLPHRLVRLLQGLLPVSWFDWIMDNVFGVYSSMQDFKGRTKNS